MPLETLWESICRLAGKEGIEGVRLDEAVKRSAVPENVAAVEVRRMLDDGLLDGDEETVRLTERGRRECFAINAKAAMGGSQDLL